MVEARVTRSGRIAKGTWLIGTMEDVFWHPFDESSRGLTVRAGANKMGSNAERDLMVERSGGESGSSGGRDVPNGNSPGDATALQDPRRANMASSPGKVPAVARQRNGHLPLDPTAWELGQDLVDRREYERAAECFRRMLLSAETPTEHLSVKAAEVAARLCVALSHERAVEKELRDACRALGRDLSRLSCEEVSLARGVLAACHAPAASMVNEAAGATARSYTLSSGVTEREGDRPLLRVHFFGRFELLRDGEAMSLGRNTRALAILKYLIARRTDRPVPQDYLMGWLWPESDPKRARWSLNSTVYALRKLLGSCLPSLSASETILFGECGYRISPRVLLSADTDEFDSRYEKGHRLEEAGRVSEAVAEYEKAAELYRGDYLIEDLYEEWTMIERERLLDAYTDLLRRLAGHYLEAGRLRESVWTCYRVLEKNRCDEDIHRMLMKCFVRLGQRARALRQYGLCEGMLRQEYDMTPSPETRALYAIILKDGSSR